jgi:hypothetical protein
MAEKIRKFAEKLIECLDCAARAAAWREGLPWDPEDGRLRKPTPPRT